MYEASRAHVPDQPDCTEEETRLMTKGFIYSIAVASLALAGSAIAAPVAPDDVKFNDDFEVKASLTGQAGDAAAGRAAFADRKKGNCLACHAATDLKDQLFHGEVGPSLDGVADRYSADQLRAIIIDSKQVFGEQTVMPGFYSMHVGINVAEKFAGKTILSAQEVEDVVAYLTTLKEQ